MSHPLIDRYRNLGISVKAAGDNLIVNAPADVLTDEIAAQIKADKPQLLAELQAAAHDKARELESWLSKLEVATHPDEVFELLETCRSLDWTDLEREQIGNTYMNTLERYYAANPDGWLVDGVPAKPRERIQIEKMLRGWYGANLVHGRVTKGQAPMVDLKDD